MNRNPKARIPEAVRDPLGPPMPGWGLGLVNILKGSRCAQWLGPCTLQSGGLGLNPAFLAHSPVWTWIRDSIILVSASASVQKKGESIYLKVWL